MSLDRYENRELILSINNSTTGQLWTDQDLSVLDTMVLVPTDPNVLLNQVSEVHIYSFYGDYVLGNHNAGYIVNDTSTRSFLFDLATVFREANINKGSYIIAVNLFQEIWGSQGQEKGIVKEISPDRTEIHFLVEKRSLNQYNEFKSKIQEFIDNGSLDNVVVNFGFNQIQKITNIRFDQDSFFVKLYQPIYDEIQEKDKAWFQFEIIDPYIDTIVLAQPLSQGKLTYMKGPNFDIDTNLYSSQGTPFRNWNELLNTNLSSQQRIIEQSISGSSIQLNIDYSDFNNFVFYSSAKTRVENFKYKVSKIEDYSSSIAILLDSTASNTTFISGSIDLNRRRIDQITSTFDPWENWLYYETTSSIFSHDLTGSLTPYPKRLVSGSWSVYPISSSISTTWYDTLLYSASYYDQVNLNRLWWSIPEHIIMNEGNDDFVKFVDMIGHHFDILYSYVNALTQIHERDEHPKRGAPNELLWHIAKSFGWELQNTRQLEDLWKYKLGKNQQGSFDYTGSMFSLSSENQTYQIWRRIVNNLPYLLKTKGTTRSLKSMMSIYGIPQTLISIKEYGGPSPMQGERPTLIEDRFIYKLRLTGSQYIEMPRRVIPASSGSWGGSTRVPDTIIFRFNTEYSSSISQSLWAIENGTNRSQVLSNLEVVHSGGLYSGSYTYGYLRLTQAQLSGSTYISSSVSTNYLPLFDDDSWSVRIYTTSPVTGSSSGNIYVDVKKVSDSLYGRISHSGSLIWSGSFNVASAWAGTDDYIVFGGTTGSRSTRFIGNVDGYKEYFETLTDSVYNSHVLNPGAYNSNTETGSFYTLFRYYPLGLDQQRWNHTTYTQVSSSHPNRLASFDTTASFKNFTGLQTNQYNSGNETFYIFPPTLGGNVLRSEKIRFEDTSLVRDLSPNARSTKNAFDLAGFDSNRLAVVFAPSDQVNNDIFNHIGYSELDSWIADPEYEFDDEYTELLRFSNEYFKKYQRRYDINALIRLLALYDYTFFEQIKQLVPGRADLITGILIEDDFLHKNKVWLTKRPVVSNPQYEGVPPIVPPSASALYLTYDTSASLKPQVEARYKYITGSIDRPLFLSGSNLHHTSSRGGYKCNIPAIDPYTGSFSETQSYIDKRRLNCCYKKVIYHYSSSGNFSSRYERDWYTAVSMSYNWYYSRSLDCTSYQYSEECNVVENRWRFGGTKLSGPGININSDNTVDKGPVITVWEVNPNSLRIEDSPLGGRLIVE